jgi:hypothetical protein
MKKRGRPPRTVGGRNLAYATSGIDSSTALVSLTA